MRSREVSVACGAVDGRALPLLDVPEGTCRRIRDLRHDREGERDWMSIPLALFDTPLVPEKIDQYFEGSQVSWCKLT